MPRTRTRKRKTRDTEVIKTERDRRRATRANDDTFELTDDEAADAKEAIDPYEQFDQRITISQSRLNRAKARKNAAVVPAEPFRFSDLPPEVRNEIYADVVVSKSGIPIRLDTGSHFFVPGGIETAVLRTSRQVYSEAIKILHERNQFQVYSCHRFACIPRGVDFRVDDPRDARVGSRQLRSGRSLGMVNYHGFIHKEVFYRLRYVEFHLDLFSRLNDCDWVVSNAVINLQNSVRAFCKNITAVMAPGIAVLQPEETNWTFVLHSTGKQGVKSLVLSLQGLFSPGMVELVQSGKLKLELRGPFPPMWKDLFRPMMCDNLLTGTLEELDEVGHDPSDLNQMVISRRIAGDDWY